MQGVLHVKKVPAPIGYSTEELKRLSELGRLGELIKDLPVLEEHNFKNRLFHGCASWFLYWLMSAPSYWGHINHEYGGNKDNHALFGKIFLVTDRTDTDNYQDGLSIASSSYTYDGLHEGEDPASSNGAKRFSKDTEIEGGIYPKLWTEATNGKQQIHYRDKWIYLPSEGNSQSIRGATIWYSSSAFDPSERFMTRGIVGRIVFKDDGGTTYTIFKNDNELLILEYQFTLVSM